MSETKRECKKTGGISLEEVLESYVHTRLYMTNHSNNNSSKGSSTIQPTTVTKVRYAWLDWSNDYPIFIDYVVQRRQAGLPTTAIDHVVPMLLPHTNSLEEARLRAKALLAAHVYLQKHQESLEGTWMTTEGQSYKVSDSLMRVLWCHLANDYFPSMFISWPIDDIIRDCFLVEQIGREAFSDVGQTMVYEFQDYQSER
jgi:hypothetical protein